MSSSSPDEAAAPLRRRDRPLRVGFLELFLDLVYILALEQLSQYLLRHLHWAGAGQTLALLLPLWWLWTVTVWGSDALDQSRARVQVLIGSMVLARSATDHDRSPARSAGAGWHNRGVNGWQAKLYRDDAVVLRGQKLGESDRIITLFTRGHGRVRAVARGVRRTTSKFGARLEPFGHVDIQIAEGRTLHSVSQVEAIDLYGKRLSDDYPRYTTASAIAEAAERLTPIEEEPALRLYLLTLGALRVLSEDSHATSLVLDSYLLRAMALAGWAPALAECAVCGTEGRHRAFSVPAGGCVCPDCRPPGSAHPSPATLELMSALAVGDWPVADVSEAGPRREAAGLVAAHLQWHLERGLRSLPLVDRGPRVGSGTKAAHDRGADEDQRTTDGDRV